MNMVSNRLSRYQFEFIDSLAHLHSLLKIAAAIAALHEILSVMTF
jgi:hypothetical protein